MVALSKDQEKILDELRGARGVYDAQSQALEEAVAESRDRLKDPIRSIIAKAESAGIPVRRIHLALDFAQVNSLHGFLRATPSKAGGRRSLLAPETTVRVNQFDSILNPVPQDRGEHEIVIESERVQGTEMVRITVASDTFGNAWTRPFMSGINDRRDFAKTQDYDEKWHGEHTDWPQVRAAIEAHVSDVYGKTNTWEG